MNINISGKVFNLPVSTRVHYDKKLNCIYVVISDDKESGVLVELIKNTFKVKYLSDIGLIEGVSGFFCEGANFPEHIYIQ